MQTRLERERDVVRRILAALEELPLRRQRLVIARLAAMYGVPAVRARPRHRENRDGKDPSDEGSFSYACEQNGAHKKGPPIMKPTPVRPTAHPLYANPWSFRRAERKRRVRFADISGQAVDAVACRRGGVWVQLPPGMIQEASVRPVEPHRERSMLLELRRRQSATMARYRLAGWCTATELKTIEALWFEKLTLRGFARREGVTPAAVGDRIERLSPKAPEFYRWWVLKNTSRRARFR